MHMSISLVSLGVGVAIQNRAIEISLIQMESAASPFRMLAGSNHQITAE